MLRTKFAVRFDVVGCVEYLHGHFVASGKRKDGQENEKVGNERERRSRAARMKKVTLLVRISRISKLDTNLRWQIFLIPSLYRGRSTFATFRHVMFRAIGIKGEDIFQQKVAMKILARLSCRLFRVSLFLFRTCALWQSLKSYSSRIKIRKSLFQMKHWCAIENSIWYGNCQKLFNASIYLWDM